MGRMIDLGDDPDANSGAKAPPTSFAAILRENMGRLSEKDQSFATSLLDAWDRNRATTKQLFWISELSKRSTSEFPKGKPVTPVEVVSPENIIELFDSAVAQGLRSPVIQISPDVGADISLSWCGERSRYPGTVNVTDKPGFGDNVWYGRLTRTGFVPSTKLPPALIREVVLSLNMLASDPMGVITRSGKKTGRCSCCGRRLTDGPSVALGVGPVCVKKYSLRYKQKPN